MWTWNMLRDSLPLKKTKKKKENKKPYYENIKNTTEIN